MPGFAVILNIKANNIEHTYKTQLQPLKPRQQIRCKPKANNTCRLSQLPDYSHVHGVQHTVIGTDNSDMCTHSNRSIVHR